MQASNLPLVAGKASGKRIRCTTPYQPTLDRLYRAAARGNYWPTIAVRELTALSSGLLDKKNVYVRPGGRDPNGYPLFSVFLPGLKATLVRWPNDDYCVVDLVLDGDYFKATSEDRTGLYRVRKSRGDDWSAKHVEDGKVLNTSGRTVAIADSGYATAYEAARKTVPSVMKASGVPTTSVRNEGCDLHHTAGNNRLGSLVRYSALVNDNCRGSAVQLAETMIDAKQLKNVIWVADKGGSAVLTQAMQILVDRGVTLHGHSVFLNLCKSSPGEALRLAHRLELTMNESFADTGWSARGAVSQILVSGVRLRNRDDPFDKGYFAHSWINGLVKVGAPVGLVASGAAALGAPIPMLANIAAVVSGGGAVYALGQSLAKDLRHRLKV
ncbi:hypothetical protein ACXYTJ_06150 [Gilvimarinus sp. F26214L]|uniref:hypothetical protein n=1 Tax=Gilvimarinus sp. DZF01 TaxID=3461371 RepID=UPI004045D643